MTTPSSDKWRGAEFAPPILNALFGCFLTGSLFMFAFFTTRNNAAEVGWGDLLGKIGFGHVAFAVVAGAFIHALHKGALSLPLGWLRKWWSESSGGGRPAALLYTGAWAYLLGEWIASHVGKTPLPQGWLWCPGVFFVAAFIADCRKVSEDDKA